MGCPLSAKLRQINLPDIALPEGERFALLVGERTPEGLCLVAQATPKIKQVRSYVRLASADKPTEATA